jgi:Amt family ammonium transporter
MNQADTAWMLISTALVLLMTPGLAFFYGGLVRTKNALNTMMMSFISLGVVGVVWALVGYSLSFAPGGALIGDLSRALLRNVGLEPQGTIPHVLFMSYQGTFAIITAALISGAIVERMRFGAYMLFIALWAAFVYSPVAHWVWGGGWLAKQGVLDYAGGIVVHVNAGTAALVTALVVGPRRGFPGTAMAPHSLPLTVLGAGMLWVGWFGFNAGSALAANGNAGMAMLVTHTGAATGALAWMLMEWLRYGKPSVLGIVTGMVAGLGTITPASGFVGPVGAIVIGGVAGIVCFAATQFLKRVLHIDDSLDVSPVHGVGGVIGTLMTGIFVDASLGGAGLAEGMTIASQIGVQAIGVFATAAWCGVVTYGILKLLDATVGLRVDAEQETEGLDLAEHGERGYTP